MEFKVMRHISGSYCVVFLGPDEYIDARKNLRFPKETFFEHVRGGHAQRYARLPNEIAPEFICAVMRNFAKGLPLYD